MGVNVVAAGKRVGQSMADSVIDNAVVTKEFRTRMRGWKPYVTMGGYVLLLIVVLAIAFWQVAEHAFRTGQYSPISDSDIGMILFSTLSITQVILLTLVLPSLTASSVTQELERRTIDMLALSKLTAGKIVLGKHLAGFFYALMLLVCSVPLAGLCLMFGGISPAEVAVTYAALAAWAFMFTSVGVMCSTLVVKTAASTLSSYGICIAYVFCTLPWGFVALGSGTIGSSTDNFVFSALNPVFVPFVALAWAKVTGVSLPVVLVSAVLQLVAGVVMILIASTHVRYQRADRALPIRALLMTFSAAVLWLIVGSLRFFGVTTPTAFEAWLAGVSIFALVMLSLAAMTFATGQIQKPGQGSLFRYALSPRRMFRGDIGGAIPFMALWTIICYAIMGQAFFWTATVARISLKASYWIVFWQIAVAALAVVIGITSLGIFFSTLTNKRRNAIGLVFATVVFLFTGYLFMLISYQLNSGVSPVWQVAALWPPTPALCAIGEFGPNGGFPTLIYRGDAWKITSAIYLLIAAGSLALAGSRHAKGYGVQEEE